MISIRESALSAEQDLPDAGSFANPQSATVQLQPIRESTDEFRPNHSFASACVTTQLPWPRSVAKVPLCENIRDRTEEGSNRRLDPPLPRRIAVKPLSQEHAPIAAREPSHSASLIHSFTPSLLLFKFAGNFAKIPILVLSETNERTFETPCFAFEFGHRSGIYSSANIRLRNEESRNHFLVAIDEMVNR